MDEMFLMDFFSVWDALETMHPYGISCFTPLFSDFGVSEEACALIDAHLHLDLMVPRTPTIRRVKMGSRSSCVVLWAYIDLTSTPVSISFQATPADPLGGTVQVDATPAAIIDAMLSRLWTLISHPCPPRQPAKRRRVD